MAYSSGEVWRYRVNPDPLSGGEWEAFALARAFKPVTLLCGEAEARTAFVELAGR
jgi:hypothetical protein